VFQDKLENGWWIDYMDGDSKQAPWVQPENDARSNGMRHGQGLCVNLLAKVRTPWRYHPLMIRFQPVFLSSALR
jgi:hypothetical protein